MDNQNVSKCPCLTLGVAMSCLDAQISLVPEHQLVVAATLSGADPHWFRGFTEIGQNFHYKYILKERKFQVEVWELD